MKFGVVTEGQVNRGMSYGERWREALEELVFAEQMGFDFVGMSEQHFMGGQWSISSPEIMLGALAVRTHRIQLRQMSVVSLGFNHPLRVAERFAALDLATGGNNRIAIGTARSNNAVSMRAFDINPDTTREEWREHVEIMIRALAGESIKHDGEFFQIEAPPMSPAWESPDLPLIYAAATSPESMFNVGKLGMNAMTADTFIGWDFQNLLIEQYRKGMAEAEPIGSLYEPSGNITIATMPAYCAATTDQAFEEASVTARGLIAGVRKLAGALAGTKAPGYQYWADLLERMDRKGDDLKYMNDSTPMLMIGDPDFFIERCYKLQEMGINEVGLKIDGYGHARTKKVIEMVGKYVIPEFKRRKGSVPENNFVNMGIENVGKFEL